MKPELDQDNLRAGKALIKRQKILESIKENRGKQGEGLNHTNITDVNELSKRVFRYSEFLGMSPDMEKLTKLSSDTLAVGLVQLRQIAQVPLDF